MRARVAAEPLGRVLLLRLAQDAEPGLVAGPVAEEGEVVVGEPARGTRPPRRPRRQLGGRLERLLAHRLPVLDRGAHLADHALEVLLELAQPALVRLPHHLGVDDGLADRALLERLGRAAGSRCSRPSASRRTESTGWMIRWTPQPRRFSSMLTESMRNGMSSVTISTAVCVDCQPCVLEARVVDAHLRRPGRALAREVEVAERQAVEVERVALGHVLRRDPAVELAGERLGELGVGAARAARARASTPPRSAPARGPRPSSRLSERSYLAGRRLEQAASPGVAPLKRSARKRRRGTWTSTRADPLAGAPPPDGSFHRTKPPAGIRQLPASGCASRSRAAAARPSARAPGSRARPPGCRPSSRARCCCSPASS